MARNRSYQKQTKTHPEVIKRRVHSSWSDHIFDESLVTQFRQSIGELIYDYNFLDDSMEGYNYDKNSEGGAINKCVPRLGDLLLPFRSIDVNSVNVVLLVDSPESTGIATGIPFYYDYTSSPPFEDNSPFVGKSVWVIERYLYEAGFRKDSQYTELMLDYNIKMFDVHEWIDQGVLPMYNSLTTDQKNTPHRKIWTTFTRMLLKRIYMHHSNTIFIGMGNDSNAMLRSLASLTSIEQSAIITSPDPTLRANLDAFIDVDPFTRANEALYKRKQTQINF